ncbi:hypothetical protein OA238_c40070 [Octadecabacter arcticus 238]|uniref:Uncharacterized protein n=1 Tax=Octadecabacter arcticus 238 TaxID=391616 RepID=M9RTX2_9RHOB|nr:hypothetical protein OA238_c40070 [Octadecabacter arcticus 238]
MTCDASSAPYLPLHDFCAQNGETPENSIISMTGKHLAHHRRSLPSRHPFVSAFLEACNPSGSGDKQETEDDTTKNDPTTHQNKTLKRLDQPTGPGA